MSDGRMTSCGTLREGTNMLGQNAKGPQAELNVEELIQAT